MVIDQSYYRLHAANQGPSLQYTNARLFEEVSQSVVSTLLQSPTVGMNIGVYAKVCLKESMMVLF